jgi:hypothetical protein
MLPGRITSSIDVVLGQQRVVVAEHLGHLALLDQPRREALGTPLLVGPRGESLREVVGAPPAGKGDEPLPLHGAERLGDALRLGPRLRLSSGMLRHGRSLHGRRLIERREGGAERALVT